jgi:hypothetical protein
MGTAIIGIGFLVWVIYKGHQSTHALMAAPKSSPVKPRLESLFLVLLIPIQIALVLGLMFGMLYGLVHLVKWMWVN